MIASRRVRAWTLLLSAGLFGCASAPLRRGEPDPATIPPELHADYELLNVRCSKCHSIARVWDSGYQDQEFWDNYVAKMRRQAGSGISPVDAEHILVFLHYYSAQGRAAKRAQDH